MSMCLHIVVGPRRSGITTLTKRLAQGKGISLSLGIGSRFLYEKVISNLMIQDVYLDYSINDGTLERIIRFVQHEGGRVILHVVTTPDNNGMEFIERHIGSIHKISLHPTTVQNWKIEGKHDVDDEDGYEPLIHPQETEGEVECTI